MDASPPDLALRWLPRLSWTAPEEPMVRARIDAVRDAPLTYPYVGATSARMPDDWYHTARYRTLGEGDALWDRAVEALRSWRMFDQSWVRLTAEGPPEVGATLGFASRQLGLWSVHVVRVVQTWEEDDGHTRRVGFAYGTLPSHAVRGEERFSLRQEGRGGPVSFGIRQFSRPNARLLQALAPLSHAYQQAFVDGAMDAMARAVQP